MAEYQNEFDDLENVESETEETEVENESVPATEPATDNAYHCSLNVTDEGQRMLVKTVAKGVVKGGIILYGLKVVKDAIVNSTPVMGIRQKMMAKKVAKLAEKAEKDLEKNSK